MRKLKDIKDVIKLLEESILDRDDRTLSKISDYELFPFGEDEVRGAREALLWVVHIKKKKKKGDESNKKLTEYQIKSPLPDKELVQKERI